MGRARGGKPLYPVKSKKNPWNVRSSWYFRKRGKREKTRGWSWKEGNTQLTPKQKGKTHKPEQRKDSKPSNGCLTTNKRLVRMLFLETSSSSETFCQAPFAAILKTLHQSRFEGIIKIPFLTITSFQGI